MSICLCYHDEQNFLHERGVCYGTKEKEPCSCGGNPVKCDFYEEVREKYFHRTNGDGIRAKTDEELAKAIVSTYGIGGVCPSNHTHLFCVLDNGCVKCWLDWLRAPAGKEVQDG